MLFSPTRLLSTAACLCLLVVFPKAGSAASLYNLGTQSLSFNGAAGSSYSPLQFSEYNGTGKLLEVDITYGGGVVANGNISASGAFTAFTNVSQFQFAASQLAPSGLPASLSLSFLDFGSVSATGSTFYNSHSNSNGTTINVTDPLKLASFLGAGTFSLTPTVNAAVSVNGASFSGSVYASGGVTISYLGTVAAPTPEPATFALMLSIGIAAILFKQRAR